MSEEEEPDAVERAAIDNDRPSTKRWVRQGVMLLVAIVVGFILYKAAASFLPRWWAQRVADQVNGGFTAGTLWGLFYGFAFTFVPLVLFFQIRRKFLNWKAKVVVAIIALALAAPNWLTLAVVASNSKAAHAGERIFDVDAPGFRWATLIGVAVGALMAVLLSGTSMLMSRRRKQVKDLKEQVKANQREKDEATEDRQEG
ncbi:MAG: LapA family protein [Actinomycetota bacterium]|nr:LapA family protein [Actinomycetota bacterium]